MDPQAALMNLLSLVAATSERDANGALIAHLEISREDALEIKEQALALMQWLARGGFAPEVTTEQLDSLYLFGCRTRAERTVRSVHNALKAAQKTRASDAAWRARIA